MSDEPDSLVLHYVRRIAQKVDRPSGDIHDVKVRLTSVEEGLAVFSDGSIVWKTAPSLSSAVSISSMDPIEMLRTLR